MPATSDVENLPGSYSVFTVDFIRSCTLSHITTYTKSDGFTPTQLTGSRITFEIPRALFTSDRLQQLINWYQRISMYITDTPITDHLRDRVIMKEFEYEIQMY